MRLQMMCNIVLLSIVSGFGEILASVNTFGTLAQQQTATQTGPSSLSVANTYGEGSGLTKVNSQSDLRTFDLGMSAFM